MNPFCMIESCRNFSFRNGLCISHETEIRKAENNALRDQGKIKIKNPIRSRSKKKVSQDRLYSVLRREYLEQNPNCEIKLLGCVGLATEIHHSAKRGDNYLNVKTWMATCRMCHSHIETVMSAKERREKGYLK